jgi:hypothetical protein
MKNENMKNKKKMKKKGSVNYNQNKDTKLKLRWITKKEKETVKSEMFINTNNKFSPFLK